MKKKVLFFLVFTVIILGGEFLLQYLGFTHAPLYTASDEYEYIATPNQNGKRFGNRYSYNSYSQRSEEPDTTKTIILGLGDSVIYGGTQSDQDSIATSIFSNETDMQMLNISAGSWGPDNCAAYLKKYGLFDAKAMFLLVSSHDAYDNMNFQPVVGKHVSYPDKQYPLAWIELFDRYIIPRLFKKNKKEADPDQKVLDGIRKDGRIFNPGFNQLKAMADSANIPLIIYLHAERSETNSGHYNEQGQEIITWAKNNGARLIKELDNPLPMDGYRDNIHVNDKGQRKIAETIKVLFATQK